VVDAKGRVDRVTVRLKDTTDLAAMAADAQKREARLSWSSVAAHAR
jgi:hypothetical protein